MAPPRGRPGSRSFHTLYSWIPASAGMTSGGFHRNDDLLNIIRPSKSHRLPIRAALGCREVAVVHFVNQLRAAEIGAPAVGLRESVATAPEFGNDLGADALLDADGKAGIDAPARRIRCRLRVLVVVGEPDHHLRVALRLH